MAKANRVIQKPKPPAVRYVAIIDPSNGLISAYASGTNIVLGSVESKRNWRDITDLPGAATLDTAKIKRVFLQGGKIKKKPRVRLVIDARKIEIGRGRAKVSYEVLEGEVEELNLTIRSNGSVRNDKIRKHQNLEIGGNSRRRITVTIDDPLIFVEEPILTINVVPPEELVTSPTPPVQEVDDVIVDKKDKPEKVKGDR